MCLCAGRTRPSTISLSKRPTRSRPSRTSWTAKHLPGDSVPQDRWQFSVMLKLTVVHCSMVISINHTIQHRIRDWWQSSRL